MGVHRRIIHSRYRNDYSTFYIFVFFSMIFSIFFHFFYYINSTELDLLSKFWWKKWRIKSAKSNFPAICSIWLMNCLSNKISIFFLTQLAYMPDSTSNRRRIVITFFDFFQTSYMCSMSQQKDTYFFLLPEIFFSPDLWAVEISYSPLGSSCLNSNILSSIHPTEILSRAFVKKRLRPEWRYHWMFSKASTNWLFSTGNV